MFGPDPRGLGERRRHSRAGAVVAGLAGNSSTQQCPGSHCLTLRPFFWPHARPVGLPAPTRPPIPNGSAHASGLKKEGRNNPAGRDINAKPRGDPGSRRRRFSGALPARTPEQGVCVSMPLLDARLYPAPPAKRSWPISDLRSGDGSFWRSVPREAPTRSANLPRFAATRAAR